MITWKKPEARIEMFEANDVIAACYYVQCLVPGGKPFGYDSSNNKHEADHCGDVQGSELKTDENDNIVWMFHNKKSGSTGACAIYEDAGYSTPKTTAKDGEMIYFTTTSENGRTTWRHYGKAALAGNHS